MLDLGEEWNQTRANEILTRRWRELPEDARKYYNKLARDMNERVERERCRTENEAAPSTGTDPAATAESGDIPDVFQQLLAEYHRSTSTASVDKDVPEPPIQAASSTGLEKPRSSARGRMPGNYNPRKTQLTWKSPLSPADFL